LEETLFDEVKVELAYDFPFTMQTIIPVFKQMLKVNNAQVIGKPICEMEG
jgi:hypothetical protein